MEVSRGCSPRTLFCYLLLPVCGMIFALVHHLDIQHLSIVPQLLSIPTKLDSNKFNSNNHPLDIHYDEGGHRGRVSGHNNHTNKIRNKTIAIGGGITSFKISPNASKETMLQQFPLFNTLIPSFCKTYTPSYTYHFYFAYDHTDNLFTRKYQLEVFHGLFYEKVSALCHNSSNLHLHLIQCAHQKKPAWAQNDAMREAYLDNMEYFYRINDDSFLVTPGWTQAFIGRLKKFDPPNVGVVGPHHSGGNMNILTYDFTHHTHQDVFGFHYPRDFTDWYADDWVTGVYKPGRVEKMAAILLRHTMQLGQRYKAHMMGKKLPSRYKVDKAILQRYIHFIKTNSNVTKDPSKVISYGLQGNNPNYTYGVLRNVQLARVYFPEWTVRVYTPNSSLPNAAPVRILKKMETLGAHIHYVHPQSSSDLAYLALTDKTLNVVLLRHPLHRLSDRQKKAVDEWLVAKSDYHCIRDHPNHANSSLIKGLIAMKNIPKYQTYFSQLIKEKQIENNLWDKHQGDFLCHDSVSCTQWKNSIPFKREFPSDQMRYEGQRFNSNEETSDVFVVKHVGDSKCL